MVEGARWGVLPKHYKIRHRPLADFSYLWEAPHFGDNPINREKVTRRQGWEKILPGLINGNNTGPIREIMVVYNLVLRNGLINPLPCIEQDGVLYPVKGNQRLCVLRAIKKLIDHRHLAKAVLDTAQQQWLEKRQIVITTGPEGTYDLDAIPCRIADHTEHPGDWTHDHPVARNHITDEVKISG